VALWVALTRALAWESPLQDASAAVIPELEFPVRSWLLELLKPWADIGRSGAVNLVRRGR
jgi:hypothetical protein